MDQNGLVILKNLTKTNKQKTELIDKFEKYLLMSPYRNRISFF